jgi:hypothetical protein
VEALVGIVSPESRTVLLFPGAFCWPLEALADDAGPKVPGYLAYGVLLKGPPGVPATLEKRNGRRSRPDNSHGGDRLT